MVSKMEPIKRRRTGMQSRKRVDQARRGKSKKGISERQRGKQRRHVGCVHAVSGYEGSVAGFDCYISSPDIVELNESNTRQKCAVVLMPDAPGFKEKGIRDLADKLANIGYYTIVPSLHRYGSWTGMDIKQLSRCGTLYKKNWSSSTHGEKSSNENQSDQESSDAREEDVAARNAEIARDDKLILSYDSWCLEEFIDEHSSFTQDCYNLIRFLKRRQGYERVGVVGCGWGGRQALLTGYMEGPVPPRYKKFLQLNYYAAAAADVVDGAMWTPPLCDAVIALSPYVVNKVDIILGRVPTLVCYGDSDLVWLRQNRNAVRDWCSDKPFLEHSPSAEQARYERAIGVGFGYMWREAVKGGVGKVSFRRSGPSSIGVTTGRSTFGISGPIAQRSTHMTIANWLNKYLDENDIEYRPPWMCALDANWLGVGASKTYSYHAQHPRQKVRGSLYRRKEIAFSGIDQDEDIDWDYGWEDVEHRNEFDEQSKWDKIS